MSDRRSSDSVSTSSGYQKALDEFDIRITDLVTDTTKDLKELRYDLQETKYDSENALKDADRRLDKIEQTVLSLKESMDAIHNLLRLNVEKQLYDIAKEIIPELP